MKSFIQFALLFALIVVGKLAKQPEGIVGTAKVKPVVNPILVKQVSYQQAIDQAYSSQLWHATAPTTSSTQ
ncbi:hypothetical protein [Hymenobacter sp.]|jgi:hypothetical protein|uniref:hypothetical protein n=1 Tax=Hymenobacter sp. TaxID=1898978 RepID=UPI002EDA37A1